jgi:hypothetical protein
MTLREAMERGGQSSRIPDYHPDPEFDYLVREYWELKCGDIDYRIHRNDLRDTLLDRNERGIILKMDRALLAVLAKERASASKKKAS